VDEDVGLDLAHEQERQRVRVGAADRAGLHGTGEVIGEDAQRAARRDVLALRVERHHHRRGMHLHGDGGTNDRTDERDRAFCEIAQDDARVRGGVDCRQVDDELGDGDGTRAHRGAEESLLRIEVAEDGRGRDFKRAGNVRQRRSSEAARAEGRTSGVEDLIAGDS